MKQLLKKAAGLMLLLCLNQALFAQQNEDPTRTNIVASDNISPSIAAPGDGTEQIVRRKPFSFITRLPGDIFQIAKTPFRKSSIKPMILTAGITGLLLPFDHSIVHYDHELSNQISLNRRVRFKELVRISGKGIGVRVPRNLNSAFYQMGEGMTSLFLAGGLFIYSKFTSDTRLANTSGEILEAVISSGLVVQGLKRITGREKPSACRETANPKWRPCPSLHKYALNEDVYGSFPSGHLATMMSVVTVLASNYPEKKWIKPVGFGLMCLTGFAMINNNSHWASDYPLGIAVGYLSGKIASHRQGHKKKFIVTLG